MYELIITENDVHLEDGTRIHRYVPPIPPRKKGKHAVYPIITWYDGTEVHTRFDLTAMNDKEASLLVWMLALHLCHTKTTALTTNRLMHLVPIDFPPRMHELKRTYDGVHGPFGRGLAKLKDQNYPWFRTGINQKPVHRGDPTYWIALEDHEQLSLIRKED